VVVPTHKIFVQAPTPDPSARRRIFPCTARSASSLISKKHGANNSNADGGRSRAVATNNSEQRIATAKRCQKDSVTTEHSIPSLQFEPSSDPSGRPLRCDPLEPVAPISDPLKRHVYILLLGLVPFLVVLQRIATVILPAMCCWLLAVDAELRGAKCVVVGRNITTLSSSLSLARCIESDSTGSWTAPRIKLQRVEAIAAIKLPNHMADHGHGQVRTWRRCHGRTDCVAVSMRHHRRTGHNLLDCRL